MKKETSIEESMFGFRKNNHAIEVYITVCAAGLIILISLFNFLIKSHDHALSQQMCALLNEKVATSITYMTNSAKDLSVVISKNDEDTFEDVYEKTRTKSQIASYISMGLILKDGTVYATPAEKSELAKQGLIRTAMETEEIFISKPYRSMINGQMVFTIFSSFTRNGERAGSLFQTYLFQQVMDIAYSESIDQNAEIWLMETQTSNIIRCFGSKDDLLGSWSNLNIGENVTTDREYMEWMEQMRSGDVRAASVTYTEDGSVYTQVFERINYMDGWSIVTRIPNRNFSTTMRTFRLAVIIFAIVFMAATVILLVSFKVRTDRERSILENLSIYDPLSQALNRRAFDYLAPQSLRKAGKMRGAIMFLDIDLFKNINDSFGHEVGDNVITAFSGELKKVFDSCGLVSRYGGDEFIVLIRNQSEEEINALIGRFQQNLAQLDIMCKEKAAGELKIQFSAGLAGFPKDGTDFKELVRRADEALYQVKAGGRNGYAWYQK